METIEIKSYQEFDNKVKEREKGDLYLVNYDFKNEENFKFFLMVYSGEGLIYPKYILIVSNEVFEEQKDDFLKFLKTVKGFKRLYRNN